MNSVTYNTGSGETTITLDQGSTFEHTFTFTSNDAPFNLTGYTARMQVRKTYGSTSTMWNGTLSNGKLEIVGPATDGKLKIIFAATDFDPSMVKFASIDDSTFDTVFDLEIQETATGKVHRPANGTLTLNRNTTR